MEIVFNMIKTMKMKKTKYIVWAGVLVLTLFIAQVAAAQNRAEQSNPVSIELLKAKSLWFNTGNGAGMIFDNLKSFSSIEANYNMTSGDFKLKQDGQDESSLGVSSEGGQKIGKAYAWGNFSYNNITQRGTLFNTASLTPHRGVPYYPVDPVLSDWKKQEYNLEMKVASKPLWNKFILGLQANYTAQTGAKQMDPRSEVYFYNINVKPGVAAMFGEHKVGLNLEYENLVDETRRHTNSNNQLSQDVFVMKGLGNHYTSVIGGLQSLASFISSGNKVGGELQYAYGFSNVKFLFNGGYTYRVEDVISNVTKPKKEGTVKEGNLSANLAVIKEGDNLSRLEISYNSNRISGIEYVQVLDNSYEVQRWVDVYSSIRSTYAQDDIVAKYDFYRGASNEYKWKAGAFANYRLNDDIYLMPKSQRKVENLYLGVNAKVNVPLKLANRFIAGADFVYKNNLDGLYNYGGAAPTSIVITDFMTPDFEFMKQSYYKIGAQVSYFTNVSRDNKTGAFIKIALDYYKPTEGDGNRVQTTFGIGLTF